MITKISEGAYAIVWQDQETSKAFKIYDNHWQQDFHTVLRELLLLRQGFGPELQGICVTSSGRFCGLSMPLALGTLDKWQTLGNVDLLAAWTMQILQRLDTLHAAGIVHGDIKSRNILIFQNGAKLCDFGLATKASTENFMSDWSCEAYTLNFRPPELLEGKKILTASDIWALGMSIYECLFGLITSDSVAPTQATQLKALVKKIPGALQERRETFTNLFMRKHGRTHDELVEFMSLSLDFDALARPKASDLVGIFKSVEFNATGSLVKALKSTRPKWFTEIELVPQHIDVLNDPLDPGPSICKTLCKLVNLDPIAVFESTKLLASQLCVLSNSSLVRATVACCLSILLWRRNLPFVTIACICKVTTKELDDLLERALIIAVKSPKWSSHWAAISN